MNTFGLLTVLLLTWTRVSQATASETVQTAFSFWGLPSALEDGLYQAKTKLLGESRVPSIPLEECKKLVSDAENRVKPNAPLQCPAPTVCPPPPVCPTTVCNTDPVHSRLDVISGHTRHIPDLLNTARLTAEAVKAALEMCKECKDLNQASLDAATELATCLGEKSMMNESHYKLEKVLQNQITEKNAELVSKDTEIAKRWREIHDLTMSLAAEKELVKDLNKERTNRWILIFFPVFQLIFVICRDASLRRSCFVAKFGTSQKGIELETFQFQWLLPSFAVQEIVYTYAWILDCGIGWCMVANVVIIGYYTVMGIYLYISWSQNPCLERCRSCSCCKPSEQQPTESSNEPASKDNSKRFVFTDDVQPKMMMWSPSPAQQLLSPQPPTKPDATSSAFNGPFDEEWAKGIERSYQLRSKSKS